MHGIEIRTARSDAINLRRTGDNFKEKIAKYTYELNLLIQRPTKTCCVLVPPLTFPLGLIRNISIIQTPHDISSQLFIVIQRPH